MNAMQRRPLMTKADADRLVKQHRTMLREQIHPLVWWGIGVLIGSPLVGLAIGLVLTHFGIFPQER